MQFHTQNRFESAYLFYMYTNFTLLFVQLILYCMNNTLYRNNLIHPVDWFPSRDSNHFPIQSDAVIVLQSFLIRNSIIFPSKTRHQKYR